MSSIIITGIDGYLGGKITKRILQDTDFDILGLTLDLDRTELMLEREGLASNDRIVFMTNDCFFTEVDSLSNVYGAIHLAFSRRMQPAVDIASSITFSSRVFHKLVELGVDRVINMSSQGVYGNTKEIRTESTPPGPETQYTMAKYATELLFEDIMSTVEHHTSLRLDPVAQSQNVIIGLCKSAIQGQIHLTGGKQVFSFIDAEDVGSAVISMLKANGTWDRIYNVGWNENRISLIELADLIANVTEGNGYTKPTITLEESNVSLWAGMNSIRFMEKTGWHPKYGIKDTLNSIIGSMRI